MSCCVADLPTCSVVLVVQSLSAVCSTFCFFHRILARTTPGYHCFLRRAPDCIPGSRSGAGRRPPVCRHPVEIRTLMNEDKHRRARTQASWDPERSSGSLRTCACSGRGGEGSRPCRQKRAWKTDDVSHRRSQTHVWRNSISPSVLFWL